MRTLLQIGLTVSAIAITAPAWAQSVTMFDGTYNGVSSVAAGGGSRCFPSTPIPRPLTIKNGAVSWGAGLTGDTIFQGSVTAQGALTAKADNGIHVYGKIDPTGKITAGSTGSGSCTITSIWQKQ